MTATDGNGIALVTGAAQGLGAAIARRLHDDGFRVAVADVNEPLALRTAREIDADGDSAAAFAVDVRDPRSLRECVDAVRGRWGDPEVLVNNAGRTVRRPVWDITAEEWDAVLETNLRGQLVATQLCAPAMRDNGWGRIVNISSYAGQQGGLVAGAHYAASKAGGLVLTKIFARELAAHGVTVNAVAPAAIHTPAMGDVSDTELAEIGHRIPVGRVGRAEEVAAAVSYLVSPDSGYITGATLDLNGGIYMR